MSCILSGKLPFYIKIEKTCITISIVCKQGIKVMI